MLNALTGIRFIAALIVVFFHFLYTDVQGVPVVRTFVEHGYVGVTLFFVLSGFIMVYAYSRTRKSKREFYWSRVARLYPLYLFSLVVAFPVFLWGILKGGLTSQGVSSLVLTPPALQAWVPMSFGWNSAAWSLSVEALWYLLFPLLLPQLLRLPVRSLPLAILGAWGVGLLAPTMYQVFLPDGAGYNWHTSSFWLDFVKFNPIVHLTDFLVGAFIGRLFIEQLPLKTWLKVLGGLIAIVAAIFSGRIPYIFMHTGLLSLSFGLFISWLAQNPPLARVLTNPFLVRLGEASYALYILHVPLHVYWSAGLQTLKIPEGTGTNLLYVVGTVLVSLGAYQWIERPAQKLLLSWWRKRHPTRATS